MTGNHHDLNVPVSVGEVVDKVTILEIKSARISDEAKLKNIRAELAQLPPAGQWWSV